MRVGRRWNPKILKCPECRNHYVRLKDLNLHLLRRHGATYCVALPATATGAATPVPRSKRGVLRRHKF